MSTRAGKALPFSTIKTNSVVGISLLFPVQFALLFQEILHVFALLDLVLLLPLPSYGRSREPCHLIRRCLSYRLGGSVSGTAGAPDRIDSVHALACAHSPACTRLQTGTARRSPFARDRSKLRRRL